MSGEASPEVLRLVEARTQARSSRDFELADRLRDQIERLGFEILDGPDGATLIATDAADRAAPERLRAEDISPVAPEEPVFDASIHWVVQGWPDDIIRSIDGFRAHTGGRSVQFVVVDCLAIDVVWPSDVEVIHVREDTGWASACNVGLGRSRGRIVLVVDGSIEPTGDVLGPLIGALEDPAVGVVGPFAIVTEDLREFESTAGPDADAVEGYLMAMRIETRRAAGGFDEKFRFYRTADIEYSFRIKDLGLRAVVVEVPVRQHEHRMWHNTPAPERERLSRKNFNRFLDRWRDRADLTVAGRTPPDAS